MPRGRPKKIEKAEKPVVDAAPPVETKTEQVETVISDASVREVPEVKTLSAEEERIRSSREVLKHPIQPGQRFYEAPDGTIIVGEADKDHVFYRQGNGGKGQFINPLR